MTARRPKPDFPVPPMPLLVPATFSSPRADRSSLTIIPSVLDAPNLLFLSAARTAFALGLRVAGIGENDEVLLPAYSSLSVVNPLLACGAKPVFYRLQESLQADTADLAGKIGPRTRAILGINFFGLSQDWRALRALADDAKLPLFEDCAHSLYGTHTGLPLGSFGDYAVASLTKFLPVWDGGLLAVNRGCPNLPTTHRRRLRVQIKAGVNLIEDAVVHGRLPWARGLPPILKLLSRLKGDKDVALASESLRRDNTGDLDTNTLLDAPSWVSLAIAVRATRGRIATRRQAAFRRYRSAIDGMMGARMPFDLAEGEVPFTVPVWIDDLAVVHARLLRRGIPMQRYAEALWPGAAAACPVTAAMARHLVQFPCHQDLADTEITRIIAAIDDELATSRGRGMGVQGG